MQRLRRHATVARALGRKVAQFMTLRVARELLWRRAAKEALMSKMRLAVLAGATALSLISVAYAGDRKKYPAFMCVEAGSTVSGTINRSEYRITRTGGAVGTTAQILCPLVRDIWDN